MAEGGRPASELYPPGGAVCSESALSTKPLLPISKSSVDMPTSPKKTDVSEGLGQICQGDQKGAASETSREHKASYPIRENDNNSQKTSGEPGEQVPGNTLKHSISGHPPEHGADPRTSVRPHSVAEPYTASHHHKEMGSMTQNIPQADGSTAQRLQPASLPVQRSHSDTLPMAKQGSLPRPPYSETCGLAYHGGNYNIQEAQGQSMLACKQAMQLQHCNIVTTTYRGGSSGAGSPMQQPQGGSVHNCAPRCANIMEDVRGEGHHQQQCEEALCCAPYTHHGNPEDTFAAYCHPQPIPAPAQMLPRTAGMEVDCRVQSAFPPDAATNLLTLPRLISSVSETGLDTKRLLGCCNLNCSWISSFPPGGGLQSQQRSGGEECCASPVNPSTTTTRDMGTMTTCKKLRDVGVQTSQTTSETGPLDPPPHVFPEVCLVEDNGSETTANQSRTAEGDGCCGPQKSPVKEVKWDAEGMTWEVYGASVDPEELGLAIQKHLELQIKETAGRAAKFSRQDTNTSRQSSNTGCRMKKSRMMGSIRTPACCARSSTAVD